jgi:uncharacterized protein YceH (UPF0502 family)
MESPDQPETIHEEPTTDHSDQEEALLTVLEARILGALMEKQLTTPDAYPLTLNSLVLACNQKSSREPVMALAEGEVKACLYKLQERKLVEFEYGSRADKYLQRLTKELHFNDAEHAIFCIMLLRGPQTVNELLTRTRRIYEFENAAEIDSLLDKLGNKLTPLIIKMPHQSGQRDDRYMHKLSGEPDMTFTLDKQAAVTDAGVPDVLVERIEALEKQVAWLIENAQS